MKILKKSLLKKNIISFTNKKFDVIFLQHTGTKGSLHQHHHYQQRQQMLPSPTTPQQRHHPPTSPVASGSNTDSQQLPCKCPNSITEYNSGTESTCKRNVSPAILYMPTPTATIASLSSPLTQISTFNTRTAPEREEEEEEEKEEEKKKEHSQENHKASRNNNTTPIRDGTPYKKYRSMYSYRSLDFSLDGVTVHGIISPSTRSSSTTPSTQHRRSSLLSASSSSFLSSPLNSSAPRSTKRGRKKSLRSASRRESSSYSPRNALKRRLSASECLSSESESDDSDDEVELPPQMKKYRDGVKNGLGVTMKIKLGDSIVYFPAYISDDSNVTPLRVSSFSEISKDFVPFITKDDIPNLLKDYETTYSELNVTHKNQLSGTGATAYVIQTTYKGRTVATKVFKQSTKEKYFRNELKFLLELGHHPHLIEFIAYTPSPRAIILEYCDHGSLFSLLHGTSSIATRLRSSAAAALPPALASIGRHAARLAIGIARGLAELHRHQIAHLDLTSRNILVGRGFVPKITDYGLSAEMGPDGTATRKLSNAPSYWKAPELCYAWERVVMTSATPSKSQSQSPSSSSSSSLIGSARVRFTMKADVFSYAVVLWEIFHPGKFPWDGDLHPDLRFCSGDRPTIGAECTPEWRMLITACWQQEPEDRPNAADIVEWMGACGSTLYEIDSDGGAGGSILDADEKLLD